MCVSLCFIHKSGRCLPAPLGTTFHPFGGWLECSDAQLCLALCDPMDWSLLCLAFSRQEHWSGLPFPSPRNLPNPGIKPTSLVTDSCIGQCILYDYATWEALEGDVTHIVATWCRVKKHGPFTKEPEGALYYFWYICIFKVLLELKRH